MSDQADTSIPQISGSSQSSRFSISSLDHGHSARPGHRRNRHPVLDGSSEYIRTPSRPQGSAYDSPNQQSPDSPRWPPSTSSLPGWLSSDGQGVPRQNINYSLPHGSSPYASPRQRGQDPHLDAFEDQRPPWDQLPNGGVARTYGNINDLIARAFLHSPPHNDRLGPHHGDVTSSTQRRRHSGDRSRSGSISDPEPQHFRVPCATCHRPAIFQKPHYAHTSNLGLCCSDCHKNRHKMRSS